MSARAPRASRACQGAALLLAALLLAACAGEKPKPAPSPATTRTAKKPWRPLGPYTPGGLYAPGVVDGAPAVPPDVANLPEPVPHPEPLARYGNRSPYVVLGKRYTVLPSAAGYDEVGVASWYGTKFDGRVTSSLEPYDLSQFSAAHRTLPLPSYARVTNLENGRSVIVRINDRGPFHDGRLIDLSYAAAIKLGVHVHGTARVEVRGIDTGAPLPPSAAPPARRAAPPPGDEDPGAARGSARRAAPARDAGSEAAPTRAASDSSTAAPPAVASPDGLAATAARPLPSPPPTRVTAPASAAAQDHPSSAAAASNRRADTAASDTAARGSADPPAAPAPEPAALTAPSPPVAPPPASAVAAAAAPDPVSQARPAPADQDPATIGFLQVGSFGDQANARRMLARLQQAGISPVRLVPVQVGTLTMWRVHVGPLRADAAAVVSARMQELGMGAPSFYRQ